MEDKMEEDQDKPAPTRTNFLCGRTGLFLIVVIYSLLGAIIFKTLEGGNEINIPQHIKKSREDCLKELWIITERLNVLYEKNWTRLVTEQLKRFEKVVIETGRNGEASTTVENRWTFGGALLYTLTLLTTIGYGKLSPKTALGKLITMLYALIGVPLMLILLSLLGSMLADFAKSVYGKLCCKEKRQVNTIVGYHKAPPSPSGVCKSSHDDCTIQILPQNANNINCNKSGHHNLHSDFHMDQDIPKRALLATVRASHARGRCRQGQVRQMLADPHFCPSHPHGIPSRSIPGSLTASDVEEPEDNDDSEHGACMHDTPSRIPLIYRPTDNNSLPPDNTEEINTPTVPALIVLCFFSSYVCIGAFIFASAKGWTFLDAAYFSFIALSTIGVYDTVPSNQEIGTQLQLFACCLYLFVGLVVVAMCFSLVQDEMANRCRKITRNLGFG